MEPALPVPTANSGTPSLVTSPPATAVTGAGNGGKREANCHVVPSAGPGNAKTAMPSSPASTSSGCPSPVKSTSAAAAAGPKGRSCSWTSALADAAPQTTAQATTSAPNGDTSAGTDHFAINQQFAAAAPAPAGQPIRERNG